MSDPLAVKRGRFLALAADVPARVRLVELSEGNALSRKLKKLKAFGPRYVRWAAARAGLKPGLVEFPLFWGKTIRLPYVDDADFVVFYLAGAPAGPEYKLARYFIRALKSSDVFYDVGANYGFYALLAGEFTKDVVAFEPMPAVAAGLVENSAGTSVKVVDAALWDSTGTATLYRHVLGDVFNTLEPKVAEANLSRAAGKIEVRCVTLDDYVKTNPPPTVIKIDVEGGEKRLLAGASATLRSARPVVAMEVWAGEAGEKFSLPAALALLELGYEVSALDDQGITSPLSADELPAFLKNMPAAWDNLVFTPV